MISFILAVAAVVTSIAVNAVVADTSVYSSSSVFTLNNELTRVNAVYVGADNLLYAVKWDFDEETQVLSQTPPSLIFKISDGSRSPLVFDIPEVPIFGIAEVPITDFGDVTTGGGFDDNPTRTKEASSSQTITLSTYGDAVEVAGMGFIASGSPSEACSRVPFTGYNNVSLTGTMHGSEVNSGMSKCIKDVTFKIPANSTQVYTIEGNTNIYELFAYVSVGDGSQVVEISLSTWK